MKRGRSYEVKTDCARSARFMAFEQQDKTVQTNEKKNDESEFGTHSVIVIVAEVQ